tara:strand:- start:308 stop:451 length:144 start_codon:yes stop_codon:yes gene_type:complete
MTEFWELMMTVLGIYLLGVLSGVAGLGILIFFYLKPGDKLTIKREEL